MIIAFIILFSSMENFFRTTFARIQARLRPQRPHQPGAQMAEGGTS
jgi:hypothetical protein